jgi:glyoxylase-like metal-dependent hydrolase (beta-lactamase superfamily II)
MYVFANALIVVGTQGVLVVDTHASPAAARAMIEHVRARTSLPVTHVVNTHWHGDHVYGNAAYRAAFPGVRIIAHASAAEDVAGPGAQMLRDELADLPTSIADRERWLATGRGDDGRELGAEDRTRVARSLRLRQGQLAELRTVQLVPPDVLVEDSLAIQLGGREVLLYHAGPAHTRGDLLVWLPAERIVGVGDLIERGVPYAGHGYPVGWVRALERIAALAPAVLVPSHGAPQHDHTLLSAQLGLLRAVVETTWAAFCAGRTGEGSVEEIVAVLMRRGAAGVEPAALESFLRDAVGRANDEAASRGTEACRRP